MQVFPVINRDMSQHFLLDQIGVRGAIVRINSSYQNLLKQHSYSAEVQKLLGEAVLACVLLAGWLKVAGNVSLHMESDTELSNLFVQCNHELQIRAVARSCLRESLTGNMLITRSQDSNTNIQQSILPQISPEICGNIIHYFTHSEQIETRLWFAVQDGQAAGLLVQRLPAPGLESFDSAWQSVIMNGSAISQHDLLMQDNFELIKRLDSGANPCLYTPRGICFHCGCTVEKMRQALSVVDPSELAGWFAAQEFISMQCEFCSKKFTFDPSAGGRACGSDQSMK